MRFLVDQDVYQATIERLKGKGYDVVSVRDLDMARASDEALLEKSIETGRILLTRDKDFGSLVFLNYKNSHGVIFLRISPSLVDAVHHQLDRLLEKKKNEDFKGLFCVVESHRSRIRRL